MAEVPSGYALRFISGKYQGGEFPLFADKEMVIGRSSDLDMVLVEDMVSRKHAKITTTGGALYIQDLGSTNGTFVNGEKIKKQRLKEGDRVLIGTSIIKVISQEESTVDARTFDPASVRTMLEDVAAQQRSATMSGTIREVPLPDLLQLFGTSKKSGVLQVISPSGNGKIFLRGGRLYYAVIDDNHDLGPMKSVCRMLGWTDGDFELLPPSDEEFLLELEDSTEAIIMEGLRQLDEMSRLRNDVPAPTQSLQLAAPLNSPLSELTKEQLDVLQLVYNFGLTQEVLNRSPGTDYETYTHLLYLLQHDYIRAL
ncbi:MAG: FHA domain-containing protein [Myxococcota bacterium]